MHRLPPEIIYEIASYIAPVDLYVDGHFPYIYRQILAMGCREIIEDTMIRAWRIYTNDADEQCIIVWCPFTFDWYPIDDTAEVNQPTRDNILRHFDECSGNWYTESRDSSGPMSTASIKNRQARVVYDEFLNHLMTIDGRIYEVIACYDSQVISYHRLPYSYMYATSTTKKCKV